MAENKADKPAVPSGPPVSEMIVEGRPLGAPGAGDAVPLEEQGLNPSRLAQAQGTPEVPGPETKEVVAAAEQFLADKADAAGVNVAGAKAMLDAADAETLWVPDSEKLSSHASPIAHSLHDHGDSDAAGTSANAPDSPDKRAFAGSKK